MRVRVYCEICNKGMEGLSASDGYAKSVLSFMLAHLTDYKELAAHNRDKFHREPKRPRFLIEEVRT